MNPKVRLAAAGRRFLPVLADVERALTVPAAEVQDGLRQLRAAVAMVGAT
jgi:hypothetical protein